MAYIDPITGERRARAKTYQDQREALRKSLGTEPVDVSTLTDEELKNRLKSFGDLNSLLGGKETTDQRRNEYKDVVESVLKASEAGKAKPDWNIIGAAGQIADAVVAGREPLKDVLGRLIPSEANANTLAREIEDKLPSSLEYYQETTKDFADQYKSIKDLSDARGRTATEGTTLKNYLEKTGPKTLADITTGQIAGERARGIQNLQDYVIPEIRQGLNVRGLLDSGDLTSEIAGATGEVLSPIEAFQFQQEEADKAFFRDAAYQDTLRKAIQGNQDLQGFVESQQALASQSSERNFQQGQTAVRNSADLAYFRRQNERALQAQNFRLNRQKDLESRSNKAGLFQGIGTGAGALAGLGIAAAMTGPLTLPIAAAGIGIGSATGGSFGGLTYGLTGARQ